MIRIPLILKLVAALAILIALAGTLGALLGTTAGCAAAPEFAPARAAAISSLFPPAHLGDPAECGDVLFLTFGTRRPSPAGACRNQKEVQAMRLHLVKRGFEPAPRRILCFGTNGIGKSTWAANAPAPIFIQTEDVLGNIDEDRFPLATQYGDVIASGCPTIGAPWMLLTLSLWLNPSQRWGCSTPSTPDGALVAVLHLAMKTGRFGIGRSKGVET